MEIKKDKQSFMEIEITILHLPWLVKDPCNIDDRIELYVFSFFLLVQTSIHSLKNIQGADKRCY